MTEDLSPYIINFDKDTCVFLENDEGDDMYFIQEGSVRIEKEVNGKKEILAHMEKGDFFGEMSLLDGIPRSASAFVVEDATLLRVDASNFESLLQSNVEIAVRMIRKYVARLRETNTKLEALLRDKNEVNEELSGILAAAKPPIQTGERKHLTPLAFLEDQVSKEKFPIMADTTLIGRYDPVTSISPEIDLSIVDVRKSVSRRHAKIQHAEGVFILAEEVGVKNGTLINQKQVTAGEAPVINDGDKLTFGALNLVFKISK